MNRIEITEWVAQWVADQVGASADEIESDRSFASYGFDEDAMHLLGEEIESFFEERVDDRSLSPRSNPAVLTRALCVLCETDEEDESEDASADYEMDETLREIGFHSVA
jgi:hypothetical protein